MWSLPVLAKDCTSQDAERIDSKIEASASWDTLYEEFRQFPQCTGDVGWLPDIYSGAVLGLLAKNSTDFSRLVQLAQKDVGFRKFVLRRINAAADQEELEAAAGNVQQHCPANAKTLCAAIEQKSKEAVKEIHEDDQIP
jgi:hypothetical protein